MSSGARQTNMSMIGGAIAMLIIAAVAPFIGTFFITGGSSASWRLTGTDSSGVTTISTANGSLSLPTAMVTQFNLLVSFVQAIIAFLGILLLLIGAGAIGLGTGGFHL